MSLVVLRSWSDGPTPKVRAIAPPDDDRTVYVPDLHGRFLTEEIVIEGDLVNGPSGAENRGKPCAISNGSVSDSDCQQQNDKKPAVLRRDPKTKNIIRATKSLSMFLPSRRSFSNVPDSLVIRPNSESSPSPENDGGSSIEYTPPASPVNGRYRNLGPELAATIPKRTIKSSWIAGIKSRRNTSTVTTHPHHRLGSSTLKSYSSSPSLAINSTSSATGAFEDDDDEAGDYFSYDKEDSIFRRLYDGQSTTGPSSYQHHNHHHHRSSAGGTEDDSQSDRSRSSLSIPYSHSPSPPLSLPITSHNNHSTLTNNIRGAGTTSVNSLRQQILSHSSKPNGLLVNGNNSSLTTTECNSEEEVFDRRCGSAYGSLLSNSSDVVLVEVIRKRQKNNEDPEKSDDSGCNSSEGGGAVKVAERAKRFSLGAEEEDILPPRKFAGVKVEGSPGKVARLKENLKRFGRFGRNQSERIVRNPQIELATTEKKNDKDLIVEKINENLNKTKETELSSLVVENKASEICHSTKEEEKSREKAENKLFEAKNEILLRAPLSIVPPYPDKETEANTTSTTSTEELHASSLLTLDTVAASKSTSAESLDSPAAPSPLAPAEVIEPKKVEAIRSGESEQQHQVQEQQPIQQNEHLLLLEKQQEQPVHNNINNIDTKSNVIEPKIKIQIQQASVDDDSVVVVRHEEDYDSSSSIVCQDRSISLQMHTMPTIDLTTPPCDNNHLQQHNGNNTRKEIEESVISSPSSAVESANIIPATNSKEHNIANGDQPTKETFVTVQVMHRIMMNGKNAHGKSKKMHNNDNSNPNCFDDSHEDEDYGDVNSNGNENGGGYAFSSSSCSSSVGGDESPNNFHQQHNGMITRKIINGRNGNNGVVSVQVPVQAVNRHVMGYGLNIVDATNNAITTASRSVSSTPPSDGKVDSDWHRSSLRDSFRGFCENLLQDKMNSLTNGPQVIENEGENEAVINFNDEDSSSSIEPYDERENSIEYISISDIKVNDQKNSNRMSTTSDSFIPSYVVALDLGSSTSGYSYWTKDMADFVQIGNVNGGTTCPTSHKIPSWVAIDDLYLDVEDDEENTSLNITPTFGHDAFDKYLTEDARGQLCHKWRAQFHESSSYPYTLDSKCSDEDLVFTMKSAIRHYGKLAWEQVGPRKKGAAAVILVSIPSSYNHRARQLVREAAFGTGLVTQQDTLALIEDPCAAGLYAYHALKSQLRGNNGSANSGDTTYLSVDIGGFYIHTSGYKISHKDGKLHQIFIPKSDAIVDSAESLFEAELSSIFTPSFMFNYQNKYRAGWLKFMTEFEQIKNRFDPLPKQKYYVFVPSSFVDHFRRFTSMEIEDALESSEIVWNKSGALGIPHWKMLRFIQPMMDFIKDKITGLVKKHQFEHVVLTGGRSGSKVLIDLIKNYLRDYPVIFHVPKEHTASVLQGATLSVVTNLSPRLIIKSPFSIGVGVMTPFIENEHPAAKKVHRDGKIWCADVWDAIIRVDQELELNKVIMRRSYVGAQPGQSVLVLPLFKSNKDPKFVTESSVQKCCELKFNSDQRSWQEVELVIRCRPSELLITAMDGGVMKNYVVVDFLE